MRIRKNINYGVRLDVRDNFYYIINHNFDDNWVTIEYLRFMVFDEIYSTEYFKVKVYELNGNKGYMELSFENEEDAQSYISWVESLIIMHKLMGD